MRTSCMPTEVAKNSMFPASGRGDKVNKNLGGGAEFAAKNS